MLEEVTQLAEAGAATLVGVILTDTWEAARAGFVRLFRRGDEGQQAAIETQLVVGAELVRQAEDAEAARQSLAPMWRFQLAELLRQHPEAIAELSSWVEESRAAQPRTHWTAIQNVDTRDNSRANAVIHGNIIVHEAKPGLNAS
ncbi:hypothetical protein [Kitasatospora sp. NPDC093558]|uniref:hypothetical protein n=1 Tax=Kitasatospora sp. NPDC093558 TaxID=3155201 RepID=UPI00343F9B71